MSALDREKARAVIQADWDMTHGFEWVLDQLGACVVPDPRITRIEALLADQRLWMRDANDSLIEGVHADQLRAILRSDQ